MTIEKNHNLNKADIYTRIDNRLNQLQKEYSNKISNTKITWNLNKNKLDFSTKTLLGNFEGILNILDTKIKLELKIPFFANTISGIIQNKITEEIDKLLT